MATARFIGVICLVCGAAPIAGCKEDLGGAGLVIESVDPGSVPAFARVSCTILGAGFTAAAPLIGVDDRDAITLRRDWTARIGDAALPAAWVTRIDDHTLEIQTPALAPGRYDIQVTSPSGARAALARALEVSTADYADLAIFDLPGAPDGGAREMTAPGDSGASDLPALDAGVLDMGPRAQLAFARPSGFAVGAGSTALATADFNRDRAPDLAAGISGSSGIVLWLGAGNASFNAGGSLQTGLAPVSVVAGDIDGDGNDDLVSADSGGADLSVLLGHGKGSFASPSTIKLPGQPVAAVAADFDKDGRVDVATCTSNNLLVVLLGYGAGAFLTTTQLAIPGNGPASIDAGDLDADGVPDLMVADRLSNTFVTWRGTGGGNFAPPVSTAGLASPQSVKLADIDGDGHLDALFANTAPDGVAVHHGRGDGTFLALASVPLAAASLPIALAAADFDLDGRLDIAVAQQSGNLVSVLLGNGNGTFAAPVGLMTAAGPASVVASDFDGDGRPDIAISCGGAAVVQVLRNLSK